MTVATEPIAETARSHLETLVPTAAPDEPVAHAVALLSSGQHAMAYAVYILDADRRPSESCQSWRCSPLAARRPYAR